MATQQQQSAIKVSFEGTLKLYSFLGFKNRSFLNSSVLGFRARKCLWLELVGLVVSY